VQTREPQPPAGSTGFNLIDYNLSRPFQSLEINIASHRRFARCST